MASGGRVVYLVLVASLALNIYLLFFRGSAQPSAGQASAPVIADAAATPEASPPLDDVAPVAGKVLPPKAQVTSAYELASLKVKGSIAQTFGMALGSDIGDLVSAFYSRIFMWPLDLKSDVRADDELTLIYHVHEDGQVDIPAASYQSSKLRKTFRAYHFLQTGQAYPHYYDENGVEVALRLVNGPIEDYEQVTSLLKDRPTHKGIDFKAPVGTTVMSPFKGEIVRTNWSHKYNGNCVEVRLSDGIIAKFLHLDKLRAGIVPGKAVKAGQALADSGNTGRSTAPHLHYQLERENGQIIDPFEAYDTWQLKLEGADLERFRALRVHLDDQLAGKLPPYGAKSAPQPEPAPAK